MYLVKMVSKATDANPNFAGEELITYHGKGDKLLKAEGSHADKVYMTCDFVRWMLEDYGYKRECDARRCWSYKNPENSKFWKSTVEVVEINT